ncbi:hypothetical protein HHO41_14970 [Bacillus sp. DNRA2]|uniref:pre-toxin TG domain-containing protein n=1 Tax=Bacillus sp. DNRA2 TaxID=2723053 RepID=UPI00145D5E1A|nr:pre-toxin TG domain-containing protein [Bacillus sp. DNRA2]NMD71601.1 hypothetical protein [Bacillus sp. DNRA2]
MGTVYGAYELSSAVSGKDLVSGRELETSERWVRGLLAPLDIVPGVSGLTKFSSTVRLAGVSDNIGKLGLSSGVKGGIQQGATARISNLVETASKFGSQRLRRAEAAFQNGAKIVKNKVIKDTIEAARVADKVVTGLRNYFRVPQKAQAFAGAGSVGKTREVIENTHTIENGVRVVLKVSDEVKIGSGGTKGRGDTIQVKNIKDEVDIIAERTKGLDLTLRETPYKIMGSKKMKQLNENVKNRTITREEWKQLMWNKRFKRRRDNGVDDFWEQERERLLNGEATRVWTEKQAKDIINGKAPKYEGKTMIGHHTYSASKYPQIANKGEIIYPLTFREHLYRWHGGSYKKSLPGKPLNNSVDNDF